MRSLSPAILSLTLIPILFLPPISHGHSHTGPGEHVQEFGQHMGEYEADVMRMVSELDRIVADYRRGEDMAGRMDGFVDLWEEVRYHEAVETVTAFLYPPIWQGIGGLRSALDKRAPEAEVLRWQRRLAGALWQGIGALKLAATGDTARPGETARFSAGAGDGVATVKRIMENLDQAVAHYAEGHVGQARTLIHDTYMQLFEGLEGELIERDPQLVVNLEEEFNATLPLLMEEGAPAQRARDVVAGMKTALRRASELLEEAEAEAAEVF